ncbi:hypothetical protein MA16_Dca000693 [Dendrobium catenatum]|uniref:RPAP1 N-terminal domain-containing protein n=1 Tax=Dendrobium catenatum TaxID=906689 RepID=A0A2I0WUK8_9ASPA|nr:hypothetical protein MA16_Dca000693 [Dendrobium catenatum]
MARVDPQLENDVNSASASALSREPISLQQTPHEPISPLSSLTQPVTVEIPTSFASSYGTDKCPTIPSWPELTKPHEDLANDKSIIGDEGFLFAASYDKSSLLIARLRQQQVNNWESLDEDPSRPSTYQLPRAPLEPINPLPACDQVPDTSARPKLRFHFTHLSPKLPISRAPNPVSGIQPDSILHTRSPVIFCSRDHTTSDMLMLNKQGFRSNMEDIHAENVARLKQVSPEEIEDAHKRVIEKINHVIVEMFVSRNDNTSGNDNEDHNFV